MNPIAVFSACGIRLEDNFVVTEDGCECISAGTPFEPKLMA